MKPVLCALAALSLSACSTLSPMKVDTKATPDVQRVQAEAKAAVDKAIAARLAHCHIWGGLGAGVGLGVVPGAKSDLNVDCLAEPYAPAQNPFLPATGAP